MDLLSCDRYAVIGNPVEHSRSPWIHAQFAQQTYQAMDYIRLLSPLDGFKATVTAFAQAGARGCNITVPFKFEAFELATHRSQRAELAQAANTLRFDESGWWADNTDGVGLLRDITVNAQTPIHAQTVLLIGAGGAAAGALGPLIEARPTSITIANRSIDKAAALVERHQPWAVQHGVNLQASSLADAGKAFDIVINATAASLNAAQIPVSDHVLRPGSLVLDMMYGPAAAAFMTWATQHQAVARDGLGMLVEQAAEAFAMWRGIRPDTTSVLREMRTLSST